MSSDDRRELIRLINEWNSSRYDLFAISQPNDVCSKSIIFYSRNHDFLNVFFLLNRTSSFMV
jgi:hypothetical protein